MKRSHSSRILALAAGLGLLASAASGWQREAALGAGGELYMIKQGIYRDLFPDAPEALAGNPVVALDVMRAGEPTERHLVPGTEDEEAERTPTIVFEDSSNAAFLVWETSINYHPILRLASFDGDRWAAAIEVRGSLFGFKSSPQIAVTRDSYSMVDAEGKPAAVSRTILHLVWAEDDGASARTQYVPLILENGKYIGRNSIIELNRFDPSPGADLAFDLAPELVRSPGVQPGRDGRTVVVAFADAASKRLVTLEIGVLPRELSQLADVARGVIIDMGARLNYPKNLAALAERARDQVMGGGGAFEPEVVRALADRVAERVLGSSGKPLQSLAGEARGVIIDMGARLSGPGLRNASAMARFGPDVAPEIVEIERQQGQPGTPSHLLQFRVASSRPAPRVQPGAATLMASRSGDDVLIATAQEGRVLYRDTKMDSAGWNDTRELKLTERMGLDRALDILHERVRDR